MDTHLSPGHAFEVSLPQSLYIYNILKREEKKETQKKLLISKTLSQNSIPLLPDQTNQTPKQHR